MSEHTDTPDTPDDDAAGTTIDAYPISWTLQPSQQAKSAAMRAVHDDLIVVGARIFNFANTTEVKAFFAEVGDDATGPLDDGVHHLFWMKSDAEPGDLTPVLIPQAMVPWFLLGVGIRDSVWTAWEYAGGPGVLPQHNAATVRPPGYDDVTDKDLDG